MIKLLIALILFLSSIYIVFPEINYELLIKSIGVGYITTFTISLIPKLIYYASNRTI